MIQRTIGLCILGLALLAMTGCASWRQRCKPLPAVQIDRTTIRYDVCPSYMMDKLCPPNPPCAGCHANACTYRRYFGFKKKTCWIIMADTEAGAKAGPHEAEHCAGGDEGAARCRDWPGTVPPYGQECRREP